MDFKLETMTENQEIELGLKIIRILNLKVKKNGRVNTTQGDKTPLGLFRTINGIVNGTVA